MDGELAEGEAVGAGGEAEVARGGGGRFRADCEGVGWVVWWTALRAEAVAAEPGGEEVAVSGCVGGGGGGVVRSEGLTLFLHGKTDPYICRKRAAEQWLWLEMTLRGDRGQG